MRLSRESVAVSEIIMSVQHFWHLLQSVLVAMAVL